MSKDTQLFIRDEPFVAFSMEFLSKLPPDLAAEFSTRQLFALYQRFGVWSGSERRRGWHATVHLLGASYALSISRRDPRDHRDQRLAEATRWGVALGALAATLVVVVLWALF